MILSNKRITKVLIRMAGLAVPLLFANTEDRFSRVEVHITVYHRAIKVKFQMEHQYVLGQVHNQMVAMHALGSTLQISFSPRLTLTLLNLILMSS